ncbi:hypothetical protein ACFYXH_02630 [Streptomyces sp. NPDC002730]|uniref:hypothetical protein n=1 Tax=Streptomyces sp. NPDC002730 TaxID=3364662 RepID=UPI003676B280
MGYTIERRGRRDYSAYLAMYGHVYGDMSDPARRESVIRSLRRRDGLTLAAARRELWREVTAMGTEDIRHALRVKRYQIEECGNVRPWNVRNADIRMFRTLSRELARRGES